MSPVPADARPGHRRRSRAVQQEENRLKTEFAQMRETDCLFQMYPQDV